MDVDPTPTPVAPIGGPDKSSTGMDAKTAAGVAALLGVLGLGIFSIIFFIIEKESQFVKFHAMQTFIMALAIYVVGIVASILTMIVIGVVLWVIPFAIWILMVIQTVKAFGGEKYMAPIFGKLAEQWAGQIKI